MNIMNILIFLPIVAGIVGGIIGGREYNRYKKMREKKYKK